MLAIVVAISKNHVIGRDGDLPWHLPTDLQHFKRLTSGHTVIMGRKTFESLGRPLPNRRNIIITRNPDYHVDGVEIVHSFDDALHAAEGDDQIFVLGGQTIYRKAMPHVDRMYITHVHADVEGDTFFPEFDEREWTVIEESHAPADDQNEYACTFRTYQRAGA